MDVLSAIILGLIQGATEFIPVSSSAHLCAFRIIFGFDPGQTYPGLDTILHAGTLFAVLFAYRKELPGLGRAALTLPSVILKKKRPDRDGRTVLFAVTATVPIVAAVLLGLGGLSERISGSLSAIGALLMINGIMLLTGDGVRGASLTADDVKPRHAIGVGLFQAVAALPGISRSGATVTGGLLLGIRRDEAVRLSFICSIPAIFGACVLKFPDAVRSFTAGAAPVYAAGALSAAAAGFLAIKLIKFIGEKPVFKYFSIYCFAAGVFALLYGIRG